MEVSAETLFNLLQTEKKSNELQPLPENFFSLAEEKQEEASMNEAESKNIKKLIAALKARRIQKVLLYLAYNKQLPQPVPEEEKEVYLKIKNMLVAEGGEKITKIRIIADVPEVITQTGNKIGPFRQNQIVELSDKESVNFLLINKIGEIIA